MNRIHDTLRNPPVSFITLTGRGGPLLVNAAHIIGVSANPQGGTWLRYGPGDSEYVAVTESFEAVAACLGVTLPEAVTP